MTAFVIAGALSWIGRWYQPGGEYARADRRAVHCHAVRGVLRRADTLPALAANPRASGRTASESGGEHRRQGPLMRFFAATRGRRRVQAAACCSLTCRGLKQLLDLAAVKHAIRPCAWMSVNGDSYNRAAGMAPCSVRCCTISSDELQLARAGRACCNQVGKCRHGGRFRSSPTREAHEHRQAGVQRARALQVAVRAARFVQQASSSLQVGSGQGVDCAAACAAPAGLHGRVRTPGPWRESARSPPHWRPGASPLRRFHRWRLQSP